MKGSLESLRSILLPGSLSIPTCARCESDGDHLRQWEQQVRSREHDCVQCTMRERESERQKERERELSERILQWRGY